MRKRRQATIRTGAKKRRRITRQQASTRTKKAWKTRYARYHYASEDADEPKLSWDKEKLKALAFEAWEARTARDEGTRHRISEMRRSVNALPRDQRRQFNQFYHFYEKEEEKARRQETLADQREGVIDALDHEAKPKPSRRRALTPEEQEQERAYLALRAAERRKSTEEAYDMGYITRIKEPGSMLKARLGQELTEKTSHRASPKEDQPKIEARLRQTLAEAGVPRHKIDSEYKEIGENIAEASRKAAIVRHLEADKRNTKRVLRQHEGSLSTAQRENLKLRLERLENAQNTARTKARAAIGRAATAADHARTIEEERGHTRFSDMEKARKDREQSSLAKHWVTPAKRDRKVDPTPRDPRLTNRARVEDLFAAGRYQGIKGRARLEADQIAWKVGALSRGTFNKYRPPGSAGRELFDPEKESSETKIAFEKAKSGIVPNRQWEYTLNIDPKETNVFTHGSRPKDPGYRKVLNFDPEGGTYTKIVEPWDTSTTFHIGKRNRVSGKIVEGDWDQFVSVKGIEDDKSQNILGGDFGTELAKRGMPLAKPFRARRRFEDTLARPELGELGIEKPAGYTLPKNVAKEIVIESHSVKRPVTRTLKKASDENYITYFRVQRHKQGDKPAWAAGAMKATGEWGGPVDVLAKRTNETDDTVTGNKGKRTKVTQEEWKRLPKEEQETKVVPKDIIVTYVPPGTAKLKKDEKDRIFIRTPRIPNPLGDTLVDEHLLFKAIDENDTGAVATALRYGVFEPKRRFESIQREEQVESVLTAMRKPGGINDISEETAQRILRDKSFQKEISSAARQRYGTPRAEAQMEAEKFGKAVIGAAAAAAMFKTQDETVHKAATGANNLLAKGIDSIFGKGAAEQRGIYVKKAYEHTGRDLLEEKIGRKRDWGMTFLRPGSDRSGRVAPASLSRGHLRYGNWRHAFTPENIWLRERFLGKGGQAMRYERGMEADFFKAQRLNEIMARSEEQIKQPGIRGRLQRHRVQAELKHKKKMAKKFNGGLLGKSTEQADAVLQAARENSVLTRFDTNKMEHVPVEITPSLVQSAANVRHQTGNERVSSYVHSVNLQRALDTKPGPLFPRTNRWSHGDITPSERNLMIGGAAVGAAVGAAYLYNRHVNKKRKEAGEDPIAFYNRTLPPAFKSPVPTPSWQTTKRFRLPKNDVNDFLMISGGKIPVGGVVHLDRKRVALRPMDRDYHSGATIGRPRLHLKTQGPTESFAQSLNVNVDQSRVRATKQKSYVPKNKRVVVFGKALPIEGTIGKPQKVKLKGTNPRRLTDQDREKLIAAAHNQEDLDRLKQFYSLGKRDKIVDWIDDDEKVAEFKRRHGTTESWDATKIFSPSSSYVGMGSEKVPEVGTPEWRDEIRKDRIQKGQQVPNSPRGNKPDPLELPVGHRKNPDKAGEYLGVRYPFSGPEQRVAHHYDDTWLNVTPRPHKASFDIDAEAQQTAFDLGRGKKKR